MLRVRTWHLCAVLLVLTAVAYLPLWGNGFVDFDDDAYITDNPHVTGGPSPQGFAWAWTTLHGKYWQPLSWLSLQLDAQLFSHRGPDGRRSLWAGGFHVESLCWHAGSALVLFGLCRRLLRGPWPAFLAAALFALHPLHVESVAWAAERKDVLSAFFGLLALAAYARYAAAPSAPRYLAVVAAYLLSLLCKPTLMTLPLLLLLLDYWPLRRAAPWRRLLLEKLPLLLLASGIAAVTVAARQHTGAAVSLEFLPLSDRLGNAAAGYGWYLYRTCCPTGLAVLYPHPLHNWSRPGAVAGAAALLLVTLLALWQARRRPWLVVGWLWFVGALMPMIGLAQGGEQAWADRFTYWPHIGLFVALACGLAELVRRWRLPALAVGSAGALALGGLGALTWLQAGYWRDTVSLWERALAVTGDNPRAHLNLGKYYLERGRPDQAERHCAEAVRLAPEVAYHHYSLGVALLALGREAAAADALDEAVRLSPNLSDAWHNLGVARLRQGKPDEAIRCFRTVLGLQPAAADTRAALGRALWRAGKPREAVAAYQDALGHNPGEFAAWQGLGEAHLAAGRPEEAVEACSEAVRLNPRSAQGWSDLGVGFGREGQWHRAVSCHLKAVELQEQVEEARRRCGADVCREPIPQVVIYRCRLAFAWHQVGDRQAAVAAYALALRRQPDWPRRFAVAAWRLATDPDPERRDPRAASELAGQALQGHDDPAAPELDALAAAQAGLGEFEAAADTARRALDRASATGETALAEAIRNRLRLYQRGQAVVEPCP
jgi:tetratricopeptide (TPR) repeat protein